MSRLTLGMFGDGFGRPKSDLFGLRSSQIRHSYITHDASWYNQSGEWLGVGDLNGEDLKRISKQLEPDEVFIIVPEEAPFRYDMQRGTRHGTFDLTHPGIDYLHEYTEYVIVPSILYHFPYPWEWDKKPGQVVTTRFGVELIVSSRDKHLEMLTAPTPASA